MSKSVGIRTTGFKGFRWVYVGGEWRKAFFFDVVQDELHPTKGWRHLGHKRKPVSEDIWFKAAQFEQRFEHAAKPADRAFNVTPLPEKDMETARLRHAWYRKQKAREAFRASP